MLLDDFWWEVGDFFCLIAKRGVAISGYPGLKDFQDVVGWFLVGSLRFYLSESGYPGFKDFQDVVGWFLVGSLRFYLSESGYPGFRDFQDVVGWFLVGSWWFFLSDSEAWRSHIRISRIWGCTGCGWMIVFWNLGIFQDVFEWLFLNNLNHL